MPIKIIAYQSRWLEEFKTLGSTLRNALGDLALRIDHIGSTSVPDLAAKDVIDIQITVSNFDNPALRVALESCGLTWRDQTVFDHIPPSQTFDSIQLEKRFAKLLEPIKANVHLRLEGRFNQRYALLCRDYLRTHAGTREAYAEVKRQLARYFPDNTEAYYDIKDPAFDLFMVGAWEWANWTNWQPSASDV
jgi:GrpB-like predicted nucleotidyltransferase (UPF0157 family)